MFKFFRKQKKTVHVYCDDNILRINDNLLSFPTDYQNLEKILGVPSRNILKDKKYFFWDDIGICCGCFDKENIIAINFYQNKKDKSTYNTKKQFKGKLFLKDKEITNNEFEKIELDQYAIHRLGSEHEIKYGFSIGLSRFNNV